MTRFTKILVGLLLTCIGTLAAAQSAYRVQPGDTLIVEVLEDSSLNRSLVVLPDGSFNFPFAGALQASGRSATQVGEAIKAAISPNFTNAPTVFVSVQPAQDRFAPKASRSSAVSSTIDVYFVGEVNKPGMLSVKSGTTLLQAIAVGGGMTNFAATKRVQLRRTDSTTGVQNVVVVNYKALANGSASNPIELKDGDVILVPERRLFE